MELSVYQIMDLIDCAFANGVKIDRYLESTETNNLGESVFYERIFIGDKIELEITYAHDRGFMNIKQGCVLIKNNSYQLKPSDACGVFINILNKIN